MLMAMTDTPGHSTLASFFTPLTEAQKALATGGYKVKEAYVTITDFAPLASNELRNAATQAKYAVPALAMVVADAHGTLHRWLVPDPKAAEALKNISTEQLFRPVQSLRMQNVAAEASLPKNMQVLDVCIKALNKGLGDKVVPGMSKVVGREFFMPVQYEEFLNNPKLSSLMSGLRRVTGALKVVTRVTALEQLAVEGKISPMLEVEGAIAAGSAATTVTSTALVWGSRVLGGEMSWGRKLLMVGAPYVAGFFGAKFGGSEMEKLGKELDEEKVVTAAITRNMAASALQEKQHARFCAILLKDEIVVIDREHPTDIQDINRWMETHKNTKDAADVAEQYALIRANYSRVDKAGARALNVIGALALPHSPAAVVAALSSGGLEQCKVCDEQMPTTLPKPILQGQKPVPLKNMPHH